MRDTFPRATRRLTATSARSWWVPPVTCILLASWAAWLLFARVTVWAVSDAARLEVEQAACSVEAMVSGRVVATHVLLGTDVTERAPLVELDSEALRLERNELLATRASRDAEIGPLAEQVRALEARLHDIARATANLAEEQLAGIREAEAALHLAASVVARSAQLAERGLLSPAELARVETDRDVHQAGLERRRAAKERADWDRRAEASELRAELAASRHRLVEVQGERAVLDARVARLDQQIEQRTIRAPISGRIGETANLRPGQFVALGARLAAIVPRGGVRIVAAFHPRDALGRVREGQRARLRLEGFPWTQYGFVAARVSSLASEALAGTVRVEAAVPGNVPFAVPLQHGWPGQLEVEVERVSPAVLVLRAAGALFAGTAAVQDRSAAQ